MSVVLCLFGDSADFAGATLSLLMVIGAVTVCFLSMREESALIECLGCGGAVAKHVPLCPHCGHAIS